MAVTAKWYGPGLLKVATGDVDLDDDTIYAAVMDDGYTPNQDTDEFLDDINSNEVSSTNYTAGGQDVSSLISITYDAGTNKVIIDVTDDIEWDPVTFDGQYLVFYKHTGTAGTSPLLFWQDAGELISASGGPWTFTPAAGGVATLTAS